MQIAQVGAPQRLQRPETPPSAAARPAGAQPAQVQPPPRAVAERVLGVKAQRQTGNGCGTTSLAMALTQVTGRNITQADIDGRLDRHLVDAFSSSDALVEMAAAYGHAGRRVNHLTRAEVVDAIQRGRPVLFLSDMTPDEHGDISRLHWRVIDGIRVHEVPGPDGPTYRLSVRIVDPYNKVTWKTWEELAPEWSYIQALHLTTGANRFGIVLGAHPSDRDLGSDRVSGMWGSALLSETAADVAYEWGRVREGSNGSWWRLAGKGGAALGAAAVFTVSQPIRYYKARRQQSAPDADPPLRRGDFVPTPAPELRPQVHQPLRAGIAPPR